MPDPFKIFMIHTLNAGTAWHRVQKFAVALSNIEDVEVRMNSYDSTNLMGAWWEPQLFDKQILETFMDSFEHWGPDIIVAQKFMTPVGLSFFETCKEFWPVLTEIDDDFINVPCWNPAFNPMADAHFYAVQQLQRSSAIICSTPYLRNFMKDINPMGYVVSNGIDIDFWNQCPDPEKHNGVRIGWAGAASHREDLEILIDVIPIINKRYPAVKWVFMSGAGIPDELIKYDNAIVCREWWPADEYPKRLKQKGFDIGLAPLKMHPFNLSKSNLRWLEYSACGIPTVASNIGHFAETIRNGENGYLCENADEWIQALSRLIEFSNYRRAMGDNARESVKSDWNINKMAENYLDILQKEVKKNETVSQ